MKEYVKTAKTTTAAKTAAILTPITVAKFASSLTASTPVNGKKIQALIRKQSSDKQELTIGLKFALRTYCIPPPNPSPRDFYDCFH